jgi:hypothetical protein
LAKINDRFIKIRSYDFESESLSPNLYRCGNAERKEGRALQGRAQPQALHHGAKLGGAIRNARYPINTFQGSFALLAIKQFISRYS